MEVETSSQPVEQEIQVLQGCNSAIQKMNDNLRTTLGNLDNLSKSVNQYLLIHLILMNRTTVLFEEWISMWRRMQENQ